MAKVNLNKTEKKASPKLKQHECLVIILTEIKITPFEPHFIKFPKTVSYEVNLASQRSHLEVILLSKFWSKKGGILIFILIDNDP